MGKISKIVIFQGTAANRNLCTRSRTKRRRTMKIVKKMIKKIVYVFICMNQDIKLRYKIQKEFENKISQSKNVNSR